MISDPQKKIIMELLQKGVEHHKAKEYFLAENCYKKVLGTDSKNYDAIRHLGIAYLDQKEFDKAERYFKKAVTVRPDLPEAFNNLGSLFFVSDKLEKAEEYFNSCLKLNSSYLPAINNIASMHNKLRQPDKAMKYASLAYSAQPENTLSIRNYANAKIINGDLYEGISILKSKIDEIQDLESISLLANTYRENGEFNLSLKYYMMALEVDPHNGHAFYNASLFKNHDLSENSVHQIIKLLDDKKFSTSKDASILCFGLYRIKEQQKKYKEAFFYLNKANEIKNELINPSFNNEKVYLKTIKKKLNKELIKKYSPYGSDSTKPIFIIGMPRSGTTLIEQILASHSKVFGAGELSYIPHTIVAPSYNDNQLGNKRYETINDWISEETISRWSNHYLNLINKISNNKQYVTDKLPHNFVHLGMIKILFPNAKIIYCKRDAMDNCYSLFKTPFESNHYYFYNQKLIGSYYKLHEEFMQHWQNECEIEMYTLDHEKLLEKPEKIISEVLKFCNLKWEDDCMNFHKTKRQVVTASSLQVREPIHKKSIRAWEKYKDQLRLMEKILDY